MKSKTNAPCLVVLGCARAACACGLRAACVRRAACAYARVCVCAHTHTQARAGTNDLYVISRLVPYLEFPCPISYPILNSIVLPRILS